MEAKELKRLEVMAAKIRLEVFKELCAFGMGHIGGSMDLAETLAVLYGKELNVDPNNKDMDDRDFFCLSKGHCGPALYATLAIKGFFPMEELSTLNKNGTRLPSHCSRMHTPGVDLTTGSLGVGVATAVGAAMGTKAMGGKGYTYCIVGDGECDEGQVWESALFAASKKLDNYIMIIDYNKKQLDGDVADVCPLDSLEDKMKAFNFYTQSIDGHDIEAIDQAVINAKAQHDAPSCIILNTVKGKGCNMAEQAAWCHAMVLMDKEANAKELEHLQGVYDALEAEWRAM